MYVPRGHAADDLRGMRGDDKLASWKQVHQECQDLALPCRMQMELDLVDADEARSIGKHSVRKFQKQAPFQVYRKQKVGQFAAGQRFEGDLGPTFLPQEEHSVHAAVRFPGSQ